MRGAFELKGYALCAAFDAASGKFTYQRMPHPFEDRFDKTSCETVRPVEAPEEPCDCPELPVLIAA